jgi:hypothetical protein
MDEAEPPTQNGYLFRLQRCDELNQQATAMAYQDVYRLLR